MLDLGREPLTPAVLVAREAGAVSGEDPAAFIDKVRSILMAACDKLALEQADVVRLF